MRVTRWGCVLSLPISLWRFNVWPRETFHLSGKSVDIEHSIVSGTNGHDTWFRVKSLTLRDWRTPKSRSARVIRSFGFCHRRGTNLRAVSFLSRMLFDETFVTLVYFSCAKSLQNLPILFWSYRVWPGIIILLPMKYEWSISKCWWHV